MRITNQCTDVWNAYQGNHPETTDTPEFTWAVESMVAVRELVIRSFAYMLLLGIRYEWMTMDCKEYADSIYVPTVDAVVHFRVHSAISNHSVGKALVNLSSYLAETDTR